MNTSFLLSTRDGPGWKSSASSVFDFHHRAEHDVEHPLQAAPLTPVPRKEPLPDEDPQPQSMVVISGGTGCNAICAAFNQDTVYILPVSDDGGSSSEIIRVLGLSLPLKTSKPFSAAFVGGPSIGDIRSRLIRLIPPSNSPAVEAIKSLLSCRLPRETKEAREEWRDIVEGRSILWAGIPSDQKELIRGKARSLITVKTKHPITRLLRSL